MTWEQAEIEWGDFLAQVEAARAALNCTHGGAWFRGHEDCAFKLIPSLYRLPFRLDPDFKKEYQDLQREHDQARKRVHELRHQLTQMQSELRSKDPSLMARYDVLRDQETDSKGRLKQLSVKLRRYELTPSGERDAFVEYCFRSGQRHASSWDALGEMQHYRVPTRLLDWTEILAIAIYFSLRLHVAALEAEWRKSKSASTEKYVLPFFLPVDLPTPAVWVMNPYNLSRDLHGRTRIWDLSRDGKYDYYARFVERRDWPFSEPIPMFSPWSHARIAAQQSMFLVWGHDRMDLSAIMSSRGKAEKNWPFREVRISPFACVYGVMVLRQLFGLSHFSIFREKEDLGGHMRQKFFM